MAGSKKYVVLGIIAIIIIGGIIFGAYNKMEQEESEAFSVINSECSDKENSVCVGVILPRSGDLSTHGNENWDSMKFSEKKINEELGNDEHVKIKLIGTDSATNPAIALEQMKKLRAEGINVILGLESSQNLAYVIDYAEDKDMIIISCCSSAYDEQFVSNNLIRLVPNDSKQGAVLAKLLHDDGIKTVIPVWRNDIWGNSLHEQVKNNFEKHGNMDDGISYHPNSPSSVSMSKLNEIVKNQVNKTGNPNEVGVLFLSFKEIAQFMKVAEKFDTSSLEEVRWYGPGAITKEHEINKNRQFSKNIDLTTVQVTPSTDPKIQQEITDINDLFVTEPSSFVYPSYDSVQIVAKAIQITQGETDLKSMTHAIKDITSKYHGTVGMTELDSYGDLAHANYTVWKLVGADWIPHGHYYYDEESEKWIK